ncbi:signal peptidase I [Streptomyces sp. YS-3]|uniref:signal peptidase I n=1 Tax=Streptomyces sp. YS-3 TaxID=3381352 RepID=UPI003862BBC7
MAVGARSGHDEPEERPDGPADSPAQARAGDGGGGTADGGPGGDGEPGGGPAPRKQRSFWKELPLLIGIALILALLIKTFLVQAFSIPSDSMQDTLQRGDRVLVDKLTPWFGSTPERGEVVVFHDPGGWLEDQKPAEPNVAQKFLSFIGLMPSAEEKDLIKRVIATGGDTVECKKGGPVKVNGKALNEPYIYPGDSACDDMPFGPIKVPKGRIWVMGDHRQNSLDSRYHQELPGGGTVSDNEVVGRAFTIAWPLNRIDWLGIPGTFDQKGLNGMAATAPVAAGLAGAVPLVLWRRRRLTRPSDAIEDAGLTREG